MYSYHPLPLLDPDYLELQDCYVILESNRPDEAGQKSFLFFEPDATLEAYDFEQVDAILKKLDAYAASSFLAGFVSYEAGYTRKQRARALPPATPLMWFGVFPRVLVFDHARNIFAELSPTGEWHDAGKTPLLAGTKPQRAFSVSAPQLAMQREAYLKKIAAIKTHIEAGDTYQVNFTTRYNFDFQGDVYAFYTELKRKQPVAYNALIKQHGRHAISLSPELFFHKQDRRMCVRPMKGTAPRGRTLAEDSEIAESLRTDEKNRSENVMIVDLLRNDLGRISQIGSVRTTELFRVEKYSSLFQMTSTIESELRDEAGYADIFEALFPSGSVTGAPKLRTMEIIRELETEPRGVYTGAIGFIAPYGEAQFNVPIRTLTITDGRGEMGVGSGIVYDSDARAEYEECQLKAKFLVEEYREFSLIETMLWDNGFARLPLHLRRLQQSAQYFDFPCDLDRIRRRLSQATARLEPDHPYKVRLLLNRQGEVSLTCERIAASQPGSRKAIVSNVRTNSADRFLFHKTTRRQLYNAELTRYRNLGYGEVIFLNEKGQVTEGAISNIFVKRQGQLLTPPVSCGLLNGVFRQHLLDTLSHARECILYPKDLLTADAIYLTNSVKGMVEVSLTC